MNGYKRLYELIDLDAIDSNIAEIRKLLKPGTRLMAVVKADGYGHGAVPVGRAIEDKVDAFGVSIIEEAIELRQGGITKPVLIFGFTASERFGELLEHNIEQTVFSLETARGLSAAAAAAGATAGVHIKIDTGMQRMGFEDSAESIGVIREIAQLPNLRINGIFSHFFGADCADKSGMQDQLSRFARFTEQLADAGVDIPVKHISNSAGVFDGECCLDMVRAGIAIFGLYTSDELDRSKAALKPAMQLKTKVIFLKTVGPGQGVSYGHIYVTTRETVIATIPVGYADGYPRSLSSRGRVIVNGQYAPVIGRVCMDLMMIDVTGIPGVETGTDVTVMGREGGAEVTAEEIGALAGSFHYEIICGLNKRVPRVYTRGGRVVETCSFFD